MPKTAPPCFDDRTLARLRRCYEEYSESNCDQVLRVIANDLERGTRHSKNSLEALNLMPRADLRDAIATLIARDKIEQADIPDRRKGGAQTYLRPIASPSKNGAGEPLANLGEPCAP